MVGGEGDLGTDPSNESVVKTEDEIVFEFVRKLEETQAAIDSDVDELVLDTNPEGQKAKLEEVKEKTRVFHKKQLAGIGDRNVIVSNLPTSARGASNYPVIYYEKDGSGKVQKISIGFIKTASPKHHAYTGLKSDSNRTWRSFCREPSPDRDILDFAANITASHLDLFSLSSLPSGGTTKEAELVRIDDSDEAKNTFAIAFTTSIDGAKGNLQKARKEASKLMEVPNRFLHDAIKDIFGTEPATATPIPPPPAANRPAGPAGRQ